MKPASEEAVRGLVRRNVTEKEMEGAQCCPVCLSDWCDRAPRESAPRDEGLRVSPSDKVSASDSLSLPPHVVEMPCGHSFHEECLAGWLKRQNTCPVCRREVEDEGGGEGKDEGGGEERRVERRGGNANSSTRGDRVNGSNSGGESGESDAEESTAGSPPPSSYLSPLRSVAPPSSGSSGSTYALSPGTSTDPRYGGAMPPPGGGGTVVSMPVLPTVPAVEMIMETVGRVSEVVGRSNAAVGGVVDDID